MKKKIAVVVSGRQDEALRMSIGLTLADDTVDVFFVDRKLQKTKDNQLNIETGKELGIHMYSNCESNDDVELLSLGELADKLTTYDHVLPY
ncbi:MAG: DsrE family protein [Gammaproteobacteria bacterium]|nr:DsrE family protein [Gammaproteobacteria bacterium]MDH5802537.1 DsrE family protein [Gammaproteobacteria bacterium]